MMLGPRTTASAELLRWVALDPSDTLHMSTELVVDPTGTLHADSTCTHARCTAVTDEIRTNAHLMNCRWGACTTCLGTRTLVRTSLRPDVLDVLVLAAETHQRLQTAVWRTADFVKEIPTLRMPYLASDKIRVCEELPGLDDLVNQLRDIGLLGSLYRELLDLSLLAHDNLVHITHAIATYDEAVLLADMWRASSAQDTEQNWHMGAPLWMSALPGSPEEAAERAAFTSATNTSADYSWRSWLRCTAPTGTLDYPAALDTAVERAVWQSWDADLLTQARSALAQSRPTVLFLRGDPHSGPVFRAPAATSYVTALAARYGIIHQLRTKDAAAAVMECSSAFWDALELNSSCKQYYNRCWYADSSDTMRVTLALTLWSESNLDSDEAWEISTAALAAA